MVSSRAAQEDEDLLESEGPRVQYTLYTTNFVIFMDTVNSNNIDRKQSKVLGTATNSLGCALLYCISCTTVVQDSTHGSKCHLNSIFTLLMASFLYVSTAVLYLLQCT